MNFVSLKVPSFIDNNINNIKNIVNIFNKIPVYKTPNGLHINLTIILRMIIKGKQQPNVSKNKN